LGFTDEILASLRASIFGRGSLSELRKVFEAMKSPSYNFIKQ